LAASEGIILPQVTMKVVSIMFSCNKLSFSHLLALTHLFLQKTAL
jgi:hypothetical protein